MSLLDNDFRPNPDGYNLKIMGVFNYGDYTISVICDEMFVMRQFAGQ